MERNANTGNVMQNSQVFQGNSLLAQQRPVLKSNVTGQNVIWSGSLNVSIPGQLDMIVPVSAISARPTMALTEL
jgi:hypothetical protein